MDAAPANDLSWLPWQTRRIIEAVGYGPALALLRARGGTRVRVPRCAQDCTMLEMALGSAETVRRFAESFPDQDYVYLPKHKKIIARLRDERIRADRLSGDSINTLALRFDLTASHIKRILARQTPCTPMVTKDLFGT